MGKLSGPSHSVLLERQWTVAPIRWAPRAVSGADRRLEGRVAAQPDNEQFCVWVGASIGEVGEESSLCAKLHVKIGCG